MSQVYRFIQFLSQVYRFIYFSISKFTSSYVQNIFPSRRLTFRLPAKLTFFLFTKFSILLCPKHLHVCKSDFLSICKSEGTTDKKTRASQHSGWTLKDELPETWVGKRAILGEVTPHERLPVTSPPTTYLVTVPTMTL